MGILRGWINFLKGQPVQPEHSISLRVSVGVVVMLAIVATAHQSNALARRRKQTTLAREKMQPSL